MPVLKLISIMYRTRDMCTFVVTSQIVICDTMTKRQKTAQMLKKNVSLGITKVVITLVLDRIETSFKNWQTQDKILHLLICEYFTQAKVMIP